MLSKEKLCFHPLLLFIILFLLSTTICHAIYAETINSTHYLRDGQTIISTGGNFKLGFFSPSNSKNRYLGIWFAKIVQQTVVWVANRENPIQDSSGTFKIGIDGNLVLVDGNENVVWSSNISILSNSSIGEILDSGNLILRQGDSNGAETILWQSFDHPSDTFLAGMKFGLNLKTGENQLLTAWRNANNPSAGKFSLGFDPNGIAQIVIWNGSHRHYRSGQWNGQQFVGVPEMTSYQLYGFNIINDTEEGRLYSLYSQFKSTISAFILSPNGELERQYWDDDKSAWAVVWSQPISECEMYGRCGLNGVCSKNKSPICSCLKGFVPSSPQNWQTGNWSEGCIRRRQLACQEDQGTSRDDVFLKISGIKLPDESQSVAVDGIEKCKVICKKNCSCVAFAYPSGLGCLTWYGDLKDLQLFPNGGQDLYFRLAKSRLKGILKMKKTALGLLVILLGVIVAIFFGISMWRKITKNNGTDEEENNQEAHMLDLGTMENLNRSYFEGNELEAVVNKRNGHGPETPLFSFDMLRAATNDFSVANKLGEGGFGPVYKGKLPNGQEIAVKRLLKVSRQRLVEFENEVILVAKLQHRNLVRLLGYCIQEENLLIYEYMPNKSLDAFLFDPLKQAQLDWRKRFDIIEGVARGLLYLHHDSRLKIIHRDLKASNVLLDKDMNPKISDFGIARIFGGQQNQDNTIRVVGTYGYMSPEYAMEGIFSVKSDIFSFGVLLLEIVSGRMNANFHHPEKPMNLLGYAWELWKDGKMLELVDPNLCMSSLSAEMSRCIRVGLLCVQDNVADRPTMDSVVFMLGSEAAVISPPKKPSFSLGRTPRLMDILDISTNTGNMSTNIVTLSVVLGR